MNYIDSRTNLLREVQSVYSKDIPSYLCKLANLQDLKRINEISKNDGVELSSFNAFKYRYTLLDHSFGMAIILDNFKVSKQHVVEALFHEIATPSFSFSEKYLKKYFKMTDFKEPKMFDKIISSENLFKKVFTGSVSMADASNYELFTLGFADFPTLSANTLEYVLSNGYFTRICDLREIEDLYENVTILHDEDEKEEFGFTDINMARKFFKLSLEVGKKKRSYEAKMTKQLISDVLMLMIRREEIELTDLFKFSDIELIKIGKRCSDKRIQEGWTMVERLNQVYTKFNPTDDRSKYCVKVDEKSIYVDPLVKTRAGTFRLTQIDDSCEKELKTYLETDTDLYMYIDYEL